MIHNLLQDYSRESSYMVRVQPVGVSMLILYTVYRYLTISLLWFREQGLKNDTFREQNYDKKLD